MAETSRLCFADWNGRTSKRYELICHQISRILPVFDRFQIEESYGKVLLRWKAKWTDKTFGAHTTSDGSLRFFALVSLLNLPSEMLPDVLLLDEPELGLHPAAVTLIGNMVESVAEEKTDHRSNPISLAGGRV